VKGPTDCLCQSGEKKRRDHQRGGTKKKSTNRLGDFFLWEGEFQWGRARALEKSGAPAGRKRVNDLPCGRETGCIKVRTRMVEILRERGKRGE